MVPPIKLYDQGVANEAAIRIMTRNSRLPDSLGGDLDAECSACRMGADRLSELFARYGTETVEACFDTILERTTETFRREILAKIPEGTWVWEDYAEHDGVDPPKLHRQRITLTKTPDKLILDLNGTSPQAKGPINHAGDYADGKFLKKWLAPILRNLADTPERMAELDVNEGVVPLLDIKFPPPGHARHAGISCSNQRPHVCDPAPARRSRRRACESHGREHAGRSGDDPLHGHRGNRSAGRVVLQPGDSRGRFWRAVLRGWVRHDPTLFQTPRTCQPSLSKDGFPFVSSGLVWRRILVAPGRIGAGSDTARRSGCWPTMRRSCRSPTVRSCRAGALMEDVLGHRFG